MSDEAHGPDGNSGGQSGDKKTATGLANLRPGYPSKELRERAAARVERAKELLAEGLTIPQVARGLCDEFDSPYRTATKDARRAMLVIGKEHQREPIEKRLARAMARADHLINLAISKGKLMIALDGMRFLAELQGLLPAAAATAVQVNVNNVRAELAASGSIGLDQYNRMRAIYGMPPIAEAQWAERNKRHVNLELPAAGPVIDVEVVSDDHDGN